MLTSLRGITFFLILFVAWPVFGQEGIGRIVALKGEVTASRDNGGENLSRNLDVGSVVYEKDLIQTSRRSFAVVEFNDQGRIALQSSSAMELTDYDGMRGKESQLVSLIKGGLRAVTGAIGKRRPEAVQYYARGTTIGIRGTTLAIRLCSSPAEPCEFSRAVSERGDVAYNQPAEGTERIFRVNTQTGQRIPITRADFSKLLGDTFVGLVDGRIWVRSSAGRFELEVQRPCLPGVVSPQNPLGRDCPPIEDQARPTPNQMPFPSPGTEPKQPQKQPPKPGGPPKPPKK